MGIWDRLGTVIKSYLNHDADKTRSGTRRKSGDPDLNDAWDELNDFLKGSDSTGPDTQRGGEKETSAKRKRPVPERLLKDFAELGLEPDASAEECKEAYKKLLKVHHPDRHAKHDGNMKKATEKTARVNASYERLTEWFKASP
jgi:DnaJ-domain-containing protein 1